jgi:hypothetical protein
MGRVSQDGGGTKGGLPQDAAWNKPKPPGAIPSNNAKSPVKGASGGSGGGTSFAKAKASLSRQDCR